MYSNNKATAQSTIVVCLSQAQLVVSSEPKCPANLRQPRFASFTDNGCSRIPQIMWARVAGSSRLAAKRWSSCHSCMRRATSYM